MKTRSMLDYGWIQRLQNILPDVSPLQDFDIMEFSDNQAIYPKGILKRSTQILKTQSSELTKQVKFQSEQGPERQSTRFRRKQNQLFSKSATALAKKGDIMIETDLIRTFFAAKFWNRPVNTVN